MARDDDVRIRAEAEALLRAAGLHHRGDLAALEVSGADRVDYLHRMLTQDVAGLPPGRATLACLLDRRGRILGEVLLWNRGGAGEGTLRLEAARTALPGVRSVLERHVIADDVTFRDDADLDAWVLAGPDALGVLVDAGLDVPAPGSFLEVAVGGHAALLLRFARRGLEAFEIRLPAIATGALEARIVGGSAARLCGPRAWGWCTVHHGIPLPGRELGEDVLFNEAGLEETVSWSKGCFPGQEPVVMAKHRGHPPRHLMAVDLEGGQEAARGADVRSDSGSIGQVTSWAPPLAHRAARALAYVRHAAAQDGAPVRVDGAGPGTLRSLG